MSTTPLGTRQIRVGILVVVTAAAFLGLVAFVIGASLHQEHRTHYLLFEQNVKGMVVGSKVNFQGVPIGAVQDIRFQSGKTLVEIRVDPTKAEIQEVTKGRLDRLLVTGQVTVELEGYEPGAGILADGAWIDTRRDPISELTRGLPEIVDGAGRVLERLDGTLAAAQRLLAPSRVDRIDRILENLETTSAALPGHVEALAAETRRVLLDLQPLCADANRAVANADALLTSTRREIEALRAELGLTVAAGRTALQRVTEAAEEARGLLARSAPTIGSMLADARDALRAFDALVRRLRAAPQSLLFGADVQEITVPARPGGGT